MVLRAVKSKPPPLGSDVQGVLTQYKIVPAHVRFYLFILFVLSTIFFHKSLVKIPDHLSYEEASTLPYVCLNLIFATF